MAQEPMTLFARIADVATVARLLRERVPDTLLDGPDEAWRRAVVRLGAGTVTFTYDRDYSLNKRRFRWCLPQGWLCE